jgi:hypothetical protein
VLPCSELPEPSFPSLVPVKLPAVFGPGSTRGWVAQLGRGELLTDPITPVLTASAAAEGLVAAALTASGVGAWFDLPPIASGSELLAEVRRQNATGPRAPAGELAAAVAEWLGWCGRAAGPLARAA